MTECRGRRAVSVIVTFLWRGSITHMLPDIYNTDQFGLDANGNKRVLGQPCLDWFYLKAEKEWMNI